MTFGLRLDQGHDTAVQHLQTEQDENFEARETKNLRKNYLLMFSIEEQVGLSGRPYNDQSNPFLGQETPGKKSQDNEDKGIAEKHVNVDSRMWF